MRTILNGVYGAVASFEISNKCQNIESKRKLDLNVKPSRKHTRATTLAQEYVLRNTLTAGLSRNDSVKSNLSSKTRNGGFGGSLSNTGDVSSLFKLRKYRNVSSRIN